MRHPPSARIPPCGLQLFSPAGRRVRRTASKLVRRSSLGRRPLKRRPDRGNRRHPVVLSVRPHPCRCFLRGDRVQTFAPCGRRLCSGCHPRTRRMGCARRGRCVRWRLGRAAGWSSCRPSTHEDRGDGHLDPHPRGARAPFEEHRVPSRRGCRRGGGGAAQPRPMLAPSRPKRGVVPTPRRRVCVRGQRDGHGVAQP